MAALSIDRLLKAARPFAADQPVVPLRVPLLGLLPRARVMLVVALVTRFPPASRTSTSTAGVITVPPVAFDGCTRNPSFAAGPTVTVNGLEVAPVSPDAPAVSVYPVPALSIVRVPKLATPLTAATVFVPPRVPFFGFVPIATVTLLVALVTRLPPASRISTCTAGVIVAPPVVFEGCTRNPSCAAAPTVMLNDADVAPASPVAVAVRV